MAAQRFTQNTLKHWLFKSISLVKAIVFSGWGDTGEGTSTRPAINRAIALHDNSGHVIGQVSGLKRAHGFIINRHRAGILHSGLVLFDKGGGDAHCAKQVRQKQTGGPCPNDQDVGLQSAP